MQLPNCNQCGGLLEGNEKFCPFCGLDIDEEISYADPEKTGEAEPDRPSTERAVKAEPDQRTTLPKKNIKLIIPLAFTLIALAIFFGIRLLGEPVSEVTEPDAETEIVEDSNSTYDIPTNYIESIDAYVKYLKFFESGYDSPELEDRIYDVVFAQDETRYISWEIELVHVPFDEDKTIFYTYKYYDPSGLIIHYDRSDFIIQAGWTNAWFSWGYGYDDPGNFITGVYYVELLVDDIVVAAGSFEIK